MNTAESALNGMRNQMAMPSRQATAWDMKFTDQEKRWILRSASVCENVNATWGEFNRDERTRISTAIRRMINWGQEFVGVFT